MNEDQTGNLVDRVEQLRWSFLPEDFGETAVYENQREIDDMTSAFLLLCHAEFEEFLEAVARKMTQVALDAWKKRMPTAEAMALLAFYVDPDPVKRNAETQKNASKNRGKDGDTANSTSLYTLMNKVSAAHQTEIGHNHGIARKNLRSLFEPLGVEIESFDREFLELVEAFSRSRGNVAHKSISARETGNPKKFYEEATEIALHLETMSFEAIY